jgi:uncharacterized protein with ParB-like and HNH nuclease domain/predicted transport protein
MKAVEANLLKFLKRSPQFVIPIYQRNYSWTAQQCKQLWDDLLRAGADEHTSAHFIGSIVYVERGLSTVTSQEALLVIDGQQRLTTTTLLIAALAEHFEERDLAELLGAFSARKLRNYYLVNPDEENERHFKLILSENDKATLLAIVKNGSLPAEQSTRVAENFKLFKEWINADSAQLERICRGLDKLVIVDISLDRAHDNPQLIFESMNSTGLELSQADLIRNYILMGLEPKLQTELYLEHWRPMEKAFGQSAYVKHFDQFMRHYLTCKTGEISNVSEVYVAFKQFAQIKGDVRGLIADIHAYANYYCAIALNAEPDPGLCQAFHDLRELKVDVAYPLLLSLYHDYKLGNLALQDFVAIVRMIESYVFRRAICALPTNALNKVFAALIKSMDRGCHKQSMEAAFLLFQTYRRFPNDEEFCRDLKARDLYNFPRRTYWLRRLENHGRKERIRVEDFTIEHIMPQNESLSAEWQTELGENWSHVQQTWLHTLGNLTLTAYNSEYRDFPFKYKQKDVIDRDGNRIGLAHSPLKLNLGLGDVPVWDEAAIKNRADRLAREALKVWAQPVLDSSVLQSYKQPVSKSVQGYSLSDHPHVCNGDMKQVFGELSKAVLALDSSVMMECLKLYIAFKADTNFVDVIPQAKRLLLILNLKFDELEDPRAICRDITGKGKWGNGDVEIGISAVDEIPYALGLIRQALDKQLMDAN